MLRFLQSLQQGLVIITRLPDLIINTSVGMSIANALGGFSRLKKGRSRLVHRAIRFAPVGKN
jgi:hypothetical protein